MLLLGLDTECAWTLKLTNVHIWMWSEFHLNNTLLWLDLVYIYFQQWPQEGGVYYDLPFREKQKLTGINKTSWYNGNTPSRSFCLQALGTERPSCCSTEWARLCMANERAWPQCCILQLETLTIKWKRVELKNVWSQSKNHWPRDSASWFTTNVVVISKVPKIIRHNTLFLLI